MNFSFRTLRIWLRRQTGKYWPSVAYTLESNFMNKLLNINQSFLLILGAPTSIYYHESSRRLFCGCDSGLLHVKKTILHCYFL